MNFLKKCGIGNDISGNTPGTGQSKTQEFTNESFLNVTANAPIRPHFLSVHDLRSLDTSASTEMDISSKRRVPHRTKSRRLEDRINGRPHSEQRLNNSSSECMADNRRPSENHLKVTFDSGVGRGSSSHLKCSPASVENLDSPSRRPPDPIQGVLRKNRKRPLKGWHERFFSLSEGCLSYTKNQGYFSRGRNKTQIDLANTYVTSQPEKLEIDIDASGFIYHLKFENPANFSHWLTAIKEHRSYDQYQNALHSLGRSGVNGVNSSNNSHLSVDGQLSTSSGASSLATPDAAPTPIRPTIALQHVPSNNPVKSNKHINRLPNEHITAMEKLIGKLENVYQDLADIQNSFLESNFPKNDSIDAETSSPTRSLFFSPTPFTLSETQCISPQSHYTRLSSVSSVTSMCTAVQAPSTVVADRQAELKGIINIFTEAMVKYTNEAKRFIEEANEALVSIQQMNQFFGNTLTPNREKNGTLTVNNTVMNERIYTESDTEGSGAENTDDSQSEDIPILNDSSMNMPDMTGVVLNNPGPVAGRRTTLPARQSSHSPFSLLALLRSNIGRDLTKLHLPALVNEPLSILQNICEEMEYSQLLDAAVEMKDRTQRMLYVVTFAISGYTSTANRTATKSFTPLLGETFECIRPEKHWRFLAEQVNNSPPVSAAHCESKLWTFDQEFGIKYKFWGKTLEVTSTGGCQLYFPRWRETYTWNKVTTSVTNLVSPTGRLLSHTGNMIVQCTNGVVGNVHFTKSDSKDPGATRCVHGTIQPPMGSSDPQRLIYGHWDKILVSRDENNQDRCIWRANPFPPNSALYYGFTQFAIELNETPPPDAIQSGYLPITDTRLRPDIRLLELGRFEDAEADNKRLEEDQKRRLRSYNTRDVDGNSNWKPLWFTRKPKIPNSVGHGSSYEFNPLYWRYRETGGFKDLKLPLLW